MDSSLLKKMPERISQKPKQLPNRFYQTGFTNHISLLRSLPGRLAIGLVRLYQVLLSPLLGPNCRYYPTCSHYAIGAIQRFGLGRGGWLALARILRCHPFQPGGYDPLPETWSWRAALGPGAIDSDAMAGRPHPLWAKYQRSGNQSIATEAIETEGIEPVNLANSEVANSEIIQPKD